MPDWRPYIEAGLRNLLLDHTRTVDIIREISNHLDAEYEEAVSAGYSAEEAVRQVLRSVDWSMLECELKRVEKVNGAKIRRARSGFGMREVSDRSVVGPIVDGLGRDLGYGLRALVRHPGFTLVVLLTLALGIGANTTIFTLVNGVLLRPLGYPDSERLVRVWPEKVLSVEMFNQLREQASSLDQMSVYRRVELTLKTESSTRLIPVSIVQIDYFRALGVPPRLGRGFEDQDQRAGGEDGIVLSDSLWRREFGADPAIVGRLVELGGEGFPQRRVIGVMPPGFRPLNQGAQGWIPLPVDPESPVFFGGYGYSAFARLTPEVAVKEASAEVRRLVPVFTEAHPTQFREVRVSPVDVVPLLDSMVQSVRSTLFILLGSVALILLIACANVANLQLVRSAGRRQEVAVRVALGASRFNLVRQFLTESALLGSLGGLGGLLVGITTISFARDALANYLPRVLEIQFDSAVFGFSLVISLGSALIFGAIPAWRSAQADPRDALLEAGRSSSLGQERNRLNGALVALEVCLAVVLVIAASLLAKSFWQLHQVDIGFDRESVLAIEVRLPEGAYDEEAVRRSYFTRLFERLRAVPGVQSVGGINVLPLSGRNVGSPYRVEGQPLPKGTPSLVANVRGATPEYFRALGIELLQGRLIDPSDPQDGELAGVINETLARLHWPEGEVVGRRILDANGDPFFRVVGVVGDIRQDQLSRPPLPEFYVSADVIDWDISFVMVRTNWDPDLMASRCRAVAESFDEKVPIIGVEVMSEVVSDSMGDSRFYTRLFAAFAGLALTLAVVGVYGVVSYAMRQRTREIGVRMVLGATPRNVSRLALKRALLPVVVGVALGSGLALGLTHLLSALLYEVEPGDPAVFVAVGACLIAVGGASSYLPVRRAARIDPIQALRDE